MTCRRCSALKTTNHVPHIWFCGMTGELIQDVDKPPESCLPPCLFVDSDQDPGMSPEVLDALEEVRPFGA